MPLRIFKYRSNLASFLVCVSHGFCFIASTYYLPLYFQLSLGKSPILSGVYILAQSGSISLASIVTGVFIRKTGQYKPPILIGLTLMTLGVGLFIDLDRNSSIAKIMVYQVITGLGIGPNFQAPLIALQSLVVPGDIAAAVATFGFTRNISTAISVVVGQVIFQNVLASKSAALASELGPSTASRLSGGQADANVNLVNALPPAQKLFVQNIFANSVSRIWIFYAAMGGLGIIFSFFITRNTLNKSHEETATGLEAQEKNRLEALKNRDLAAEKRAEQRAARASKSGQSQRKESV